MKRIFVYGSLRKGMYNYERYLRNKSTFIGYGYVKGELFSLQHVVYPALLQGDEDIIGEIYEIQQAEADALDELEGYQPGNVDNEYDKIVSEICLQDAATTVALPVYYFNMRKRDHQKRLGDKICENDYVAYMKRKDA